MAEHGLAETCVEAAGREILEHAAACDALLVVAESLPAEVIDGLANCRVIARLGAGTDKIDVAAATRRGIVVTNVPDFCVEEQADHALALLLALVRKLPQMDRAMREGAWSEARRQCRTIRRFSGRTLGLVGFGGSAQALARRAAGFGFRLIATRRRPAEPNALASSLGLEFVSLDTLVREADYVSLHIPLNDETRLLFNAERLAAMRAGAFLINTSRGALVDEPALVAAVRSGHLSGAGLDTFHGIDVHGPESPVRHALLELENVICTPHVAAFSVESSRDVAHGAVESVVAVLSGTWPRPERIVNPDVVPHESLIAERSTTFSDYAPGRTDRQHSRARRRATRARPFFRSARRDPVRPSRWRRWCVSPRRSHRLSRDRRTGRRAKK